MNRIKAIVVIGTRPEVIKMAPVAKALEKRSDRFESVVALTGQHRQMCRPYLDLFGIEPDYDLDIMQPNQSLNGIVAAVLSRFPAIIDAFKPDIVLVQGDTSSAFAAALAAYHAGVDVGHVEAGLRTGNKRNPFPEEMNRRMIGAIGDYHFAPTPRAHANLLGEGIAPERVWVTGNTVIDALKMVVRPTYRFDDERLARIDFDRRRVICVTTHRRESFGAPLLNTLRALREIVSRFADVEIVLPVHYNPNVRSHVMAALEQVERIHLIEPLAYEPFVHLLAKSHLILTDSGGVQEEAPALGKPVLVLRETTERPEGVDAGTARLVGTDVERIVSAVQELLDNEEHYKAMARAKNPYGDGTAARQIVEIIEARAGTKAGTALEQHR